MRFFLLILQWYNKKTGNSIAMCIKEGKLFNQFTDFSYGYRYVALAGFVWYCLQILTIILMHSSRNMIINNNHLC